MSRRRIGSRRCLNFRSSTIPAPVWPTGALGNLNQVGGVLTWNVGQSYDYNNVTLLNVAITISGTTGSPPKIGVAGNLSMTGCTVNGLTNQDFFYPAGSPVLHNYSFTALSGKVFSYSVTPAQGGVGDSDEAMQFSGGAGVSGSGGGGGGGAGAGTDGEAPGGGNGGNGDGGSIGGVGGHVFGNAGSPGGPDGVDFIGCGGGGGALGISGLNFFCQVVGNVTAFSGNTFNLYGSPGGAGGDGVGPSDSYIGGGGGGGGGGFSGAAQFFIHGTGSASITAGQFSLSGGTGGAGGAFGGVGGGTPGGNGQNGSLIVTTY